MKIALLALLLLIAPVYASPSQNPHPNLVATVDGLWIQPAQHNTDGQARFIRFVVLPCEYSGSALLEVSLKALKGRIPNQAALRLVRNGVDLIAEDYTYWNGENYTLYLPDLQKDERVEFSIGFDGAVLAQFDVVALLTTDQRQKAAHWRGNLRR